MTAMPSEAVTHSSSALSNSNIGNVENQSSCASAQSDTASRVVEEDHNFTNIPLEALQQAGINVEGGTAIQEEQMNPLMMLTNRTSSVNAATHVHDKSELVGSSSESSTENLDSLTMLISGDGSLKLTDTSNREILFTAEQLAAENIDVNNLTDESIQHVIQMAYHINKEPVQKRRKLESNTNINNVHRISYDDALISTSSAMDHASIASTSSQQVTVPNDHRFDLIGEVVDVKKGNKIFPATIRYCKPGYFKVQHSDGHFEWVTHDQIQMRGCKERSDHEVYGGHVESERVRTPVSAIGSSGIGRRIPPAIPGIKVTSANLSQKEEEPNFCCVICDRKVYQKEPQYIVIRIPACDDCTQEKITVIDSISENRYTQGTQTEDGTFQTNGFVNHQCSGVTAASSEGTNSDVANEDGVPTDPQQAVSSSDS